MQYIEKYPQISIIIPVYNDPNGIKDTLSSLVAQAYSGNYEIIVADNGSNDVTINAIKHYQEKYPDLIRLVIEKKIQSSYAARNKGLEVAKGSIIAFIDSDMTVEKDWLQKIKQSMAEHNSDYLGCRVEIYSESNSFSALYNKLSGFPMDEYIHKRHFAPTCCLIVRKSIFEHVGLFDPKLISSGDYEFGNRVFNAGYKLHYDPEVVMYHPARKSLRNILKKSFRIGRGFYQVSYYYPQLSKTMKKSSIPSISNNNSWNIFTFRKESYLWNKLPIWKKAGVYFVDILNKCMKPIGYAYEKYIK